MPNVTDRIAALEAEIRRLKQERDGALDRVRQLESEKAERETEIRNQRTDMSRIEACFRIAASAGTMGAYRRNFQTGDDYWSPEFLAIYGLGAGEPLSLKDAIPAAVHPEDRPRVLAEARERLSRPSQPEFESEHRIVRPDGEVRWTKILGCMEFGPEGEPLGAHGIVRDITESKRGEEQLSEAMEDAAERAAEAEKARTVLDAILEHIPDGLAVCDEEGRVVRCSRYGIELSGMTREELEGSTPEERRQRMGLFLPDGVTPAIEGDLPTVRVLRTGLPVTNWELLIRRSDGRDIPIRSNAGPIIDRNGNVRGAVHVWRNIAELKRSEETVRKTEERFQSTFEQAAVGMAHVGLDGRFLRVNQKLCGIVGYSREELQEKTFQEITFPEDLEADLVQSQRLLRGEIDHYQMEKRYRHREGHTVWINLTGALQRTGDGSPKFYIAVIEDICERKAMEKEIARAKTAAEEASRAKSEFLANMSHEIRTPMTAFMAALEHLRELDGDPERCRILDIADQSARRLRALIDDILDFSRIEARRVELRDELFDLTACIRSIEEMFSLPAREKNFRLHADIAPEVPALVVGDSDRLGQVLINLVGNAVKFTEEGEIRIAVRTRGDSLEFSVRDTGIGIPDEKLGQLFEQFTQASDHRLEGTGLGLAISRGLVELMGGEISVESRVGEGSIFSFAVPLKPVRAGGSLPEEAAAEATGEQTPAVRILLAEDDPMIREVVSTMLEKRGWKAVTAENGKEALRMWEEDDFDLILMDLQMPEMDGIDATRAIRQREDEKSGRVRIVGVTAHARYEIQEECLAAGMDDVLLKPVQMKDLFSAVDRFLSTEAA